MGTPGTSFLGTPRDDCACKMLSLEEVHWIHTITHFLQDYFLNLKVDLITISMIMGGGRGEEAYETIRNSAWVKLSVLKK